MRTLFTTGAVAVAMLATGGAPSAVADQAGSTQLRVTVGSPQARASAVTAGAAAAATCTINKITINRYSECEWVAVHVDVIKIVDGDPVVEGTADFSVKHQMTLKANTANWSEKFTISKARTTGQGKGVAVDVAAVSGGGTKATVDFPQGHTLDSAASGSVHYKTGAIARKKINPKAKTTYTYTFTKAGYSPGTVSYASAVYRCDNYYGTTGCAIPEVPTGINLSTLPRISEGIRKLRSHGGHYGDPNGGKPLHWMINATQQKKNRQAVCSGSAPADMQRAGRTSCDEYPFASTYEGGTNLPAAQRTITWVKKSENDGQGAFITNWRRQFHVMDHDPFYVIA
ncbi:NucA/NucB deoxyribonuclease domain-containing protein [Streptomyces coacervatus]|uniref:NucA/NucB deoxyribonuclease domain-containing protein n=1 Tax=Streptomyces coacervatus TaxID=647381 RepID=UPI0023DC9F49|nr:NucA/NucB deoxyribonuclease domain-containing protein [Streptomyces coacervatus]MDF2273421.1 NucA/NucB deoxyribonuclease domain-containing protein [Streptomyces coacervatus]